LFRAPATIHAPATMSFSFFPNPLTTDVLVWSADDPGLHPIGNWKCNDGCSSAAGAGSSTVVLLQRRSNVMETSVLAAWLVWVVVFRSRRSGALRWLFRYCCSADSQVDAVESWTRRCRCVEPRRGGSGSPSSTWFCCFVVREKKNSRWAWLQGVWRRCSGSEGVWRRRRVREFGTRTLNKVYGLGSINDRGIKSYRPRSYSTRGQSLRCQWQFRNFGEHWQVIGLGWVITEA